MVSLLWAGYIVCVYTCVYYYVVLCGQDPSLVECCSLSIGERTRRWRLCQDHGLFLYRGQVSCITHGFSVLVYACVCACMCVCYQLYIVKLIFKEFLSFVRGT